MALSKTLVCNSAVTSPYCYFTPYHVGVRRTEIAGRRFHSHTYIHKHKYMSVVKENNQAFVGQYTLGYLNQLYMRYVALRFRSVLNQTTIAERESRSGLAVSQQEASNLPIKTLSVCRPWSSAAAV